MSSSKESKDRFEKTFSRKKKENTATSSTTSEKKTKTGEKSKEKPVPQTPTKSSTDKHTNITVVGLKYHQPRDPSKKTTKKKKNVDSDGSLKPKQPKPNPEKDREKKRKSDDENVGVKRVVFKMPKKEKTEKDDEEGLECAFPTARITRIIKSDGLDCKITGEAVFLINKATEKFIEVLCEDAYGCAVEDRKTKAFVAYKHLASVVSNGKLFDFLTDFIPEKVTAEKALAERNPSIV